MPVRNIKRQAAARRLGAPLSLETGMTTAFGGDSHGLPVGGGLWLSGDLLVVGKIGLQRKGGPPPIRSSGPAGGDVGDGDGDSAGRLRDGRAGSSSLSSWPLCSTPSAATTSATWANALTVGGPAQLKVVNIRLNDDPTHLPRPRRFTTGSHPAFCQCLQRRGQGAPPASSTTPVSGAQKSGGPTRFGFHSPSLPAPLRWAMQTTQDSGAATSDDDVESGIDHDDPTRTDLYAVSEFLGIAPHVRTA
jgi:hypothetical protein